ncbi:WD repeat-containing protein 88 [Antechinus flavipes]|uniref:WD repeat-containing protein 88 n=1 Tax=Antechinus flavipes TaxID=38775 RepID=UPI00223665DE|nr:WD repeat-containing protein 88 [Antechinus flavipes]
MACGACNVWWELCASVCCCVGDAQHLCELCAGVQILECLKRARRSVFCVTFCEDLYPCRRGRRALCEVCAPSPSAGRAALCARCALRHRVRGGRRFVRGVRSVTECGAGGALCEVCAPSPSAGRAALCARCALRHRVRGGRRFIPFKMLKGHNQAVSSCHFCIEDTKILSSSYDKTVKIWDAVTGINIHNFENCHMGPISECSLTADSTRFITSSYDKTIKLWDMESGQVLWSFNHDSIILSCKISFDGKYVICGLDIENALCVIDAKNGNVITYVKDHHVKPITTCCFNPDSLRIASASSNLDMKIWDISAKATLLTIHNAHSNIIADCCFTFSGHFLCTAAWDKTLKIWDVNTGGFRNEGACVTLMEGHEGSVSSCFFTSDASLVVSGSYDKIVNVWDVAGGYRKCTLKGHGDWVMDVEISKNQKWVISASKDTSLRLWNIENVDQIPLFVEYRRSHGFYRIQCEKCKRPFSLPQAEDEEFEPPTQCVFCRLASSKYSLPISSELYEDEKDVQKKEK